MKDETFLGCSSRGSSFCVLVSFLKRRSVWISLILAEDIVRTFASFQPPSSCPRLPDFCNSLSLPVCTGTKLEDK